MGALDRLRGANGDDGFVGRARTNPRLVVAIAGGAVLLIAWIGWAIHVTSDHGARAGLGVVIAWPAMLAALAIISLPFIGGYLLIKRLSPSEDEGGVATAEADAPDADEDVEENSGEDEEEPEGEDEEDEPEDEDESDEDEDEESEPDAETSSAS